LGSGTDFDIQVLREKRFYFVSFALPNWDKNSSYPVPLLRGSSAAALTTEGMGVMI
jgi:hypothetical protein